MCHESNSRETAEKLEAEVKLIELQRIDHGKEGGKADAERFLAGIPLGTGDVANPLHRISGGIVDAQCRVESRPAVLRREERRLGTYVETIMNNRVSIVF